MPNWIRQDVFIPNQSDAFVITSKDFAGRTFRGEFGGRNWRSFVKDGVFIPISLYQDDDVIVRVLLNEGLTTDEQHEWCDRTSTKLLVPSGKLTFGGGFEFLNDAESGTELQTLTIPIGTYRVDIFVCIAGINGTLPKRKPLGKWFRETRPKEKFSPWVADQCRSKPKQDPGFEEKWERSTGTSEESLGVVDFLVQLTRLSQAEPLPKAPHKLDEHGCLVFGSQIRVPEICPKGLIPVDPIGAPTVDPSDQEKLHIHIPVGERVGKFPITKVKGGPVEIWIDKLRYVYALAWMGAKAPIPEIRIELPRGSTFDAEWPTVAQGVKVNRTRNGFRVDCEAMNAMGTQFTFCNLVGSLLRELPDGAIVDLFTCEADGGKKRKEPGTQRYRGPIERRRWKITESYPKLDAETLSEGLKFFQQAIDCRPFVLDTKKQVDQVVKAARDHFYLQQKKILVNEKSISIEQGDTEAYFALACKVFRVRFANAWPVLSPKEL